MTTKPFNTVMSAKSIKTATWVNEPGDYDMTLQSAKMTHTATSGTPCIRTTYLNADRTLMVTDSVLITDNGVVGFDKYARLAGVDLSVEAEIDLFAVIESLKGRTFKVTCERIDDGRIVVRNVGKPAAENRKLTVVSTNAIKPASAKDAG